MGEIPPVKAPPPADRTPSPRTPHPRTPPHPTPSARPPSPRAPSPRTPVPIPRPGYVLSHALLHPPPSVADVSDDPGARRTDLHVVQHHPGLIRIGPWRRRARPRYASL